ncbi:MAG: 2-C-methyl-D-erythritol 4-phosphate cytidylyltransferase [Prolixibacteraceae bacterium]
MDELHALIVAGGTGNRMNSDIPKQFMLLNNKPVLMQTILQFIKFDPNINIILVLPIVQIEIWQRLCKDHHFEIKHHLVAGGQVRFQSVKNGLDAISENGIVFIHDGVRPLVSQATIQRCLDTACEKGNAVPVLPLIESLRQIENENNKMVDRSQFVTIQTPQVFSVKEIKAAYKLGFDPAFTDDTSVLERTGASIHLVDGNRENIKITHPIDFLIAEALMKQV